MKALRRIFLFLSILLLTPVLTTAVCAKETADPLPSWNDGPTKTAILEFVHNVTLKDGPNYVRPEERIATFDNDGTLWCEQPVVQLEFVVHQIKKMAPAHPEWAETEPYKAVLSGDKKFLLNDMETNHGKMVMELMETTHTGISLAEFYQSVGEFFSKARHPKYQRKYTETIYQPMLELLVHLRANGFKTYICSGGGTDFMRVISEEGGGFLAVDTKHEVF